MLAFFCASVLCLALGEAVPGPRLDQDPPTSAGVRPPIERLREQLRARPREERARLERHLQEFEDLPPAARVRLLERARALRAQERSLEEARAREPRVARRELAPERGSEQWRAQLREGFRARGKELRARLPAELRQKLEQAPPEVRRTVLERMVQRHEQASLRALAGMREDLGLSEREIQRLKRMPLADRLGVLRELLSRSRRQNDGQGRLRR